jgi:hypothetical protein
MKKIYFWIAIIFFTLVISSCAKKEESDDSDDSTCVTSTTASGSITVGSETMSGVYASSCVTENLTDFPSDTKGIKMVKVVTGDSALSEEFLIYTDTSCSTNSGHIKWGRTSVTVGDASGSNYKVTYTASTVKVLANTTVAETAIESMFEDSIDLTVGTEFSASDSGESGKNLFYVDSTTIRTADVVADNESYPTDIDSPTMTKTCE